MSGTPGLELSQDVLYGIAQLALDGVEGVRAITPPTRVGEFLTGRRAKGIVITRQEDQIDIALTVAMTYGERIPLVARAVQQAVREAVASMTGLSVRTVDVHVEAIDVPVPAEGGAPPPAPERASLRRKRGKVQEPESEPRG